ncbi:MAG: glycoside hydrolase family 76 protein [Solirubrobacteraceae bacterium]
MIDPELYANRALTAYAAMQDRFRRPDGLYRRERLRWPPLAEHLWPFSRALGATLDLAGMPEGLAPGFDAAAEIADRLRALERYRDRGSRTADGYRADVAGLRPRGDYYYDDNAWIGLALVQLERMRPGSGTLERAGRVYELAAGGWDRRTDVSSPGGVFWVQQGRGAGRRNHDRNVVSNAPNAELGLHLLELAGSAGSGPAPGQRWPVAPERMYEWVNATLDTSPDEPGGGLFRDKVRGDESVDRALWSYNQGTMIGANVLLARRAEGSVGALHLRRAELIARRSLKHYDGAWQRQPADFNGILFHNLLLLHALTEDAALGEAILAALRECAELAWLASLTAGGRRRTVTLRHQAAVVQLNALLAWSPGAYDRLA